MYKRWIEGRGQKYRDPGNSGITKSRQLKGEEQVDSRLWKLGTWEDRNCPACSQVRIREKVFP